MAVNGKNKGNAYERKISNLLSARFENKTGIKQAFRRNPDSGSFFGGTNQKRIETHNMENATLGDINCPNNFKYSIECKHYKKAPLFSNILTQNCTEWDKWIKQAEQDSSNTNKKLLIIIKYNNVEEFVLVKEAIPGSATIVYKDYFVVPLKHFLTLPDTQFFED